MAITATFNAANGTLSIFGDNLDNNTTVSRTAAGGLLVNGGAVSILGGTSTVANTTLIQVFGQGGNDVLTISEVNGALPDANVFGGAGNDTITSGSGTDQLFGQAGNDRLAGGGGADLLFGGDDNDVLIGGDGDDQLFGQAGNDRMVWNPGDDSDLHEGGEGDDTSEINGGNGNEVFTLTANGTRVRFDRVDPAPFSLDIGTTERIVVNMNGGDDTFSATGNLAALVSVTVDGGTGNDTILGSNGNDFLLGGDGNDFIDGQQGADTVLLGAGDDVFQWDPGDGSDTVEGQDGNDTMLFNGANNAEIFEVGANGERARFTRNVANITMDLNELERIDLRALGGQDIFNVTDLAGTDVKEINVDLAETTDEADAVVLLGRGGGTNFVFANEGAALVATGLGAKVTVSNAGALDQVVAVGVNGGFVDTFTVNGAATNDAIHIVANGADVQVQGLATTLTVRGDGGDRLLINTGAGDDVIDAQGNLINGPAITIDGGEGNDRILGSNGLDVLIGGDGNDFIDGQQGNDTVFMGAGDDVFQWDPGDGSDAVEGDAGNDTMVFNGSAVAERIVISANGDRERITRDVGNIVMDMDNIERSEVLAGAGNDTIDASALGNRMALSLFGDAGDDRIIGGGGADLINGGDGADFINGGAGADTVLMGAGNDRFQWNPGEGSDVIDGQAGFDTHEFNGSSGAEIIRLDANGGHATLTRNLGNIVMDQDNVERVEIAALGGADSITIGDQRGTDVREVLVDLTGVAGGGAGDGVIDSVTVGGSSRSDFIDVSASGDNVTVDGLTAETRIANLDRDDAVVVDGGAGSDIINASSMTANAAITLAGGAGNDIVIGGRGGMTLSGGAGDDLLIGGSGNDVLDAGTGRDVLVGGSGNDLFHGDDDFTILDFRAGAGSDDRIDLRDRAGIEDFSDVLDSAHNVFGGVVLDFGDDHITLLGVNASQLHADDFLI